ncbi:thioredoxin [Thiomonas bhubaneswarensis]|uniref:Thioredoxin n=1 Tax=Thiomonas bhubaneswarensis TaxID=339866 RepID=A0A0K6HVC4_9BURK|nr:thioredoxin [Thiomonas bhubaneswarensis]CUA94723.1 thioredoxin [Thiomonas bhubaneswarensis]
MIDATVANFETEVVEASNTVPVLVDLWAPWCGPCRALGPILEKLEVAYEGRFKLVKINTEEEQELAAAFGVRSIPMVMLLKNGQPVDGFVGALPEGQIREFLDKHVPDTAPDQGDEAPAPEAGAAAGPALSPLEKLQQDLAANPANEAARKTYVELLLKDGRTAEAKMAFEPLAGKALADARIQALGDWLAAAQAAPGLPAVEALQASISANKRDFDARYALAQQHMAAQQWTAALDELLDILMRDKTWSDDRARKTFVNILELMTPADAPKPAPGQPPATDPTVESYRRRLSMTVLS